jgi:hypothetical protein
VPDEIITAAYKGLDLDLPNGKHITAKPLDYKDGIVFLSDLTEYEEGRKSIQDALQPVLQRFPAAVGLEPQELDGLTVAEVYILVKHFLFLDRTPRPAAAGKPVPSPSSV